MKDDVAWSSSSHCWVCSNDLISRLASLTWTANANLCQAAGIVPCRSREVDLAEKGITTCCGKTSAGYAQRQTIVQNSS